MTPLVGIRRGRALPAFFVVALVAGRVRHRADIPCRWGHGPADGAVHAAGRLGGLDRRDHGVGLDSILRAAAALR